MSYFSAKRNGSLYLPGSTINLVDPTTDLPQLTYDTTAATLSFSSTISPFITQIQRSGTGTNDGTDFVIKAQAGQNQTGVASNNDGGDVIVWAGAPGTGGSGAAGERGGIVYKVGDQTLFKTDYSFSVPITTLDPSQSGLYFYAPTSGQGIFLSADTQVGLTALGASGLISLVGKNINNYDTSNVLCSSWTLNGTGATSLSFGSTVTGLTINQTQRSGNGVNAGAALTIQAQQGQNVSSGTNNFGGTLNLFAGSVGTGGVGSQDGTVFIGSGSSKIASYYWNGASAIIGMEQVTTDFNAQATGRNILFTTFGSGLINLRAAGGLYNVTPNIYYYDASTLLAATWTLSGGGDTSLTFAQGVDSVTISQANRVGSSQGRNFTIQAQNAGTNASGGQLRLKSGAKAGSGNNGDVIISTGSVARLTIQGESGAGNTTLIGSSNNNIITETLEDITIGDGYGDTVVTAESVSIAGNANQSANGVNLFPSGFGTSLPRIATKSAQLTTTDGYATTLLNWLPPNHTTAIVHWTVTARGTGVDIFGAWAFITRDGTSSSYDVATLDPSGANIPMTYSFSGFPLVSVTVIPDGGRLFWVVTGEVGITVNWNLILDTHLGAGI